MKIHWAFIVFALGALAAAHAYLTVGAQEPAAAASVPTALTDLQWATLIYDAITLPMPSPDGNPANARPGLAIERLRVEVKGRQVILSGIADSDRDRRDAAMRAAAVGGGFTIVNDITVR